MDCSKLFPYQVFRLRDLLIAEVGYRPVAGCRVQQRVSCEREAMG